MVAFSLDYFTSDMCIFIYNIFLQRHFFFVLLREYSNKYFNRNVFRFGNQSFCFHKLNLVYSRKNANETNKRNGVSESSNQFYIYIYSFYHIEHVWCSTDIELDTRLTRALLLTVRLALDNRRMARQYLVWWS